MICNYCKIKSSWDKKNCTFCDSYIKLFKYFYYVMTSLKIYPNFETIQDMLYDEFEIKC